MLSRRVTLIHSLLYLISKALCVLRTHTTHNGRDFLCQKQGDAHDDERLDCEALMLGRLIRCLSNHGLYHDTHIDPPNYRGSVATLERKLRTISIRGHPGRDHVNCVPIPHHAASIDTVINRLSSIASVDQLRHLAAQAEKSGISS